MTKKIKLEVTDAQLKAIISMKDDMQGMIGCGDDDKYIKHVNNMLKANNITQDGKLIIKKNNDSCPKCGSPLIPKSSGVKCSKCDYWFCY